MDSHPRALVYLSWATLSIWPVLSQSNNKRTAWWLNSVVSAYVLNVVVVHDARITAVVVVVS